MRFILFFLLVLAGPITSCSAQPAFASAREPDFGRYSRPAEFKGVRYSSFYLPMRDGVRIAADLYLPKGLRAGQRIPAILEQTRYGRSLRFRIPLRWFLDNEPFSERLLVTHGYAWIKIDVRGSGASFGQVLYPWSIDEIRDGNEVVNWIVRQPWSDGRVGLTGLSYLGEAAEFALANRNPAVKSAAIRFAMWDAYQDQIYPGGLYLQWFVDTWSKLGIKLDRGDFSAFPFKWYVPIVVEGFRPVSADRDGSELRAALASHSTFDLTKGIGAGYRDDPPPSDAIRMAQRFSPAVQGQIRAALQSGSGGIALINPMLRARDIAASGASILAVDGWFDGANSRGALQRYLALDNPQRLIVGPWIHGITRNQLSGENFDLAAEWLRFFDYELKGIHNGAMSGPPLIYYTMVENKWKTSSQWPLKNQTIVPLYFAAEHALASTRPEGQGEDEYRVDLSAGTGRRSRWEPLMGKEASGGSSILDYGDRSRVDRILLVYDSAPLTRDTEVTGHPILTLYLESSAPDGEFFAYLEDVSPGGGVRYVTEGELRAIDRKITDDGSRFCSIVPCHSFLKKDGAPMTAGKVAEIKFDLLPTSYLFRKRHSIRLALAGADKDHFQVLSGPAPTWRVQRAAAYPSAIELPVIPR